MRLNLAIAVLLTLAFQLLFATTGRGQNIATEKVTLGLKDESLETAIKKIEQQSNFRFFYRDADIRPVTHLNLKPGTRTIEQTLATLLQNTPLTFRQIDANILLERKDQESSHEISGKVLNGADKTPLANASVFLSNATVGDMTTVDGSFNLHNVKPGKYELVVSIIGFEPLRQDILVNYSDIILPEIEASPQTISLKEVTVKPLNDGNRARNYAWFKDEFLGTSALAAECKILNPEIIDLDYDDATNTLTASSNDFIIIENQALGYKIKYLLASFIKDTNKDAKDNNADMIHYEGSALFENLKGTPAQERRWKKQRKEVYEGSAMQFLRSAVNGRTDGEGFRVLRLERCINPDRPNDSLIEAKIKLYKKSRSKVTAGRDSLSFWVKKNKLPKMLEKLVLAPLNKEDFIRPTDQQGLFAFGPGNADDAFYVTYNKDQRFSLDPQPAKLYDPGNVENTLVNFDVPYVFFDANGEIVNSNCLTLTGVWGRERVAELLPVDYEAAPNTVAAAAKTVLPNNDSQVSFATPASLKQDLLKLKATSDSVNENQAIEKLYLQLDKPYYTLGDTVWFKAYLLNLSHLAASGKSGIINIDIANDSNKVVKQYKLPVNKGLSWGGINLDEKEFSSGTYTIRAYTTWMRNFGSDYFFTKSFYVTGGAESNWLVNRQLKTSTVEGSNTENVKLQLSDINKKPATNQGIQLQVMAGSKRLYKQTVQTDENGFLDVNFKIPEKFSDLTIVAENEQKDKRAVVPVAVNETENADIQFLPEGGSLIAGLPARIGFKAIDKNGKGINISGIVTDHEQNQVAVFKSLHYGMGSFYLTIKDGESYEAKVSLSTGMIKEYPLPAIKSTGMVLKVKNPMESDSVEVFVAGTADIIQSGNSYFLIGKARGIICYAAIFNFHEGNYVKKKIAKSLFPAGIAHFTVMDTKYQPLNERLVYIDRHDDLHIQLTLDKSGYGPRDSVSLKIKVTDNTGHAVSGNFSLAVTDNAQVKTDTLNSENIIGRMLLTSDLKGYVEAPGYYFSAKTSEAWQALDNLLLTQGWIGYNWPQVFNPPVIAYGPEQEFAVKGNVVNVFNRPVKGTDVLLFSKTPAILMDTTTNKDGKFVFDHFPRVDTPLFVLKAVNKNGKSFNVLIRMDDVKPPEFTKPNTPLTDPWYVNSDTTLLNYAKISASLRQQDYFPAGGHRLKEVKIKGKKIVTGSQNLNGPGNADVVLDEKDLEKAGKKNFLQLLEESVKNFRETMYTSFTHNGSPNTMLRWYYISDKPVIVLVDGVFLSSMYSPFTFLDFKSYLESHNAEDIKGIEVMSSDGFALNYAARIRAKMDLFAFIEITTRSGHGPIIDNTPGMYLYKPLAINAPKQFYKPKYTINDTANHLPDLRSTIDWEPNITTGIDGKAKVSFYSADKPSSYAVVVEGSDMNGNLGYKSIKINVGGK